MKFTKYPRPPISLKHKRVLVKISEENLMFLRQIVVEDVTFQLPISQVNFCIHPNHTLCALKIVMRLRLKYKRKITFIPYLMKTHEVKCEITVLIQ